MEIYLETRVAEVNGSEVVLSNGERIITNWIIWTAGPRPIRCSLLVRAKRTAERFADEFLAVPGHEGVWAVGDCTAITDSRTGKLYPPTAQHAIRQGRVLARNITATIAAGAANPSVRDHRPARRPRPSHRRCTDLWLQLLRLHRLVAVANNLPHETPPLREKSARRAGLEHSTCSSQKTRYNS